MIDRTSEDPRIVTSGTTVNHALLDNTHAAGQDQFLAYAKSLLNVTPSRTSA